MAAVAGGRRISHEWVQWALVVVGSFGLAAIVRDGEILAPLRRVLVRWDCMAALLRCWLCLGWWAAIPIAHGVGIRGRLLLVAPFVAAGAVYIMGAMLSTIQIDELPPTTGAGDE